MENIDTAASLHEIQDLDEWLLLRLDEIHHGQPREVLLPKEGLRVVEEALEEALGSRMSRLLLVEIRELASYGRVALERASNSEKWLVGGQVFALVYVLDEAKVFVLAFEGLDEGEGLPLLGQMLLRAHELTVIDLTVRHELHPINDWGWVSGTSH